MLDVTMPFKLVADEKDRAPFRLQLPHKLEEFLDLQRRQDGRRLIQGYRQVNEFGVDDWVSAGHVDSP